PTGVAFVWRRVPWSAAARLDQNPFNASSGLRIVIGDARGASHEGLLPLGWIQFEHGSPFPENYLSYRNATQYMTHPPPVGRATGRRAPQQTGVQAAAGGGPRPREWPRPLFAGLEGPPPRGSEAGEPYRLRVLRFLPARLRDRRGPTAVHCPAVARRRDRQP